MDNSGGEQKDPVFSSKDIAKTQANSNKTYFVNVIDNPFEQWLLRKKPSKVKTEQKFETTVAVPASPTEKPKKPQCKTTIRLTTERLKRDSAKYKTTIMILATVSAFALCISIALAVLLVINSNTTPVVETKIQTEYVDIEKPSAEQVNDLCEFYLLKISEEEDGQDYVQKYNQLCSIEEEVPDSLRGGGVNEE